MENLASQEKKFKVAIVGGGLVGSLSSCFFAKRGHEVHLYEYREDIRKAQHVRGRSINLAMSTRARLALQEVGLEDALIKHHGIPMRGRMIHDLAGSRHPILYDPRDNKCIYSVSRRYLNEVLLSATEKFPNVHLHFNHKLTRADLNKGRMTFLRTDTSEVVEDTANLVVGADGAFSAVRREFLKQPLFHYSQTYIEHGYLELSIPPGQDGQFLMEPNYLHIWPRGNFMMIALPNQDHSWTVTLFMPFPDFEALDDRSKLLEFFRQHFPDSLPLIGEERLVSEFFASKPSFLVSIKSRPYHLGSKAVLIGDAAHAMVPFYGQGMNAGFEDCQLLDKLMVHNDFDLSVVLEEFSSIRCKDAAVICDLAMYNYIEMRDLVNRPSFLLRKKLDNFLFWLFPSAWVPLYTSVTFTNMNYSQCLRNRQWQDKIVRRATITMGAVAAVGISLGVRRLWNEMGSSFLQNCRNYF